MSLSIPRQLINMLISEAENSNYTDFISYKNAVYLRNFIPACNEDAIIVNGIMLMYNKEKEENDEKMNA